MAQGWVVSGFMQFQFARSIRLCIGSHPPLTRKISRTKSRYKIAFVPLLRGSQEYTKLPGISRPHISLYPRSPFRAISRALGRILHSSIFFHPSYPVRTDYAPLIFSVVFCIRPESKIVVNRRSEMRSRPRAIINALQNS